MFKKNRKSILAAGGNMDKLNHIMERVGSLLIENNRKKSINDILEIAEFGKIKQPSLNKLETMVIVLPKLKFSSGGGSSIIRIGNYLAKQGIKVYYVAYNNDDVTSLTKSATASIKDFSGVYLTYNEAVNMQFDVVMATNWQSVYYARRLKGYKLYFVQDYEPLFHAMNEEHLLAKKTYSFGFKIISLGPWNAEQINKYTENREKIEYITFPYEPKEYSLVKRDYSNYAKRKKFKLAVYIKESGRRIPFIIQHILYNANRELNSMGYELDINFYGCNKSEKLLVGKNLGALSKADLNSLYQSADFGMVASMTNISLVPYEMIATGLPIFEFKDGSFKNFLGTDSAILIDVDYHDFVNKFIEYTKEPEKLEKMQSVAFSHIKNLSWDKTCLEFYNVLLSIVNKEDQN